MIRAARLTNHGQPLEPRDLPDPKPGPGEVLVEITHAGVNPIDRYNAEGSVAPDGPLPRTLGGEACGRLADGTVVLVSGEGLGSTRDGVWATRAAVPEAAVTPAPTTLAPEVIASMGIAGLTAWSVVALRAEVRKGDTVLVLGAGGGVGLAAVSLAAARGATVWGQVGTASKADAVRAAGAVEVRVGEERSITDLEPTVVIDPLGAAFAETALRILRPRGRYVVFGTSAGKEVTLDWQQVYRRGLTIHGQGNIVFTTEERRRHLSDTLAAAAAGDLRIPIEATLPLAAVNDALEALRDRSVTGKIVLSLTTD